MRLIPSQHDYSRDNFCKTTLCAFRVSIAQHSSLNIIAYAKSGTMSLTFMLMRISAKCHGIAQVQAEGAHPDAVADDSSSMQVVRLGRSLEVLLRQFMVFGGLDCAHVAQASLLSWRRFVLQSLHMLRIYQTVIDRDLAAWIDKGDPTIRTDTTSKTNAERACILARIKRLMLGATG